MTYEESRKLQEQEFKYLDTIDIRKYLINNRPVHYCKLDIERIYGNDYTKMTGDEYIFNVIDDEEFMQYVKKRYPEITYFGNEYSNEELYVRNNYKEDEGREDMDPYELCWNDGIYSDECVCEFCPYNVECSGYISEFEDIEESEVTDYNFTEEEN